MFIDVFALKMFRVNAAESVGSVALPELESDFACRHKVLGIRIRPVCAERYQASMPSKASVSIAPARSATASIHASRPRVLPPSEKIPFSFGRAADYLGVGF